ncbi:hypothetical protein Daus18300_012623 [Diaporthe australafricana]|uniref:GP-PDE domain-containing protein n=1 Tax=Diaporthe australafricana TaxID=127596 RepID=A0ABR3W213_9PEZI
MTQLAHRYTGYTVKVPFSFAFWPLQKTVKLPTFEITPEYFRGWVRRLAPPGTNVPALIERYAGQSFLRNFQPGRKYVVAHRGFQGAYPEGVLPEQCLKGLNAPYNCGVNTVELDVTFTAAKDRQEIVGHDLIVDRVLPISGLYSETTYSAIKKLNFVFKQVGSDGLGTGDMYESMERPTTTAEFLKEVFFQHDGDVYYDTRETAAGEKIASYIQMVATENNNAIRTKLIENAVFQVYPHGYAAGGNALRADIVRNFGPDADLEKLVPFIDRIKLSVVMPHNGMEMVVDEDSKHDPHARYKAGLTFIDSFHEAGFRVAVHIIPIRGENNWMTEEYKLNERKFVKLFGRDPQPRDTTDFANDKILHQLLWRCKGAYPSIPILAVSRAMTSSIGQTLLYHSYRDRHASVVDRFANSEHYFNYEQSIPGSALRRGADIELTDRVAHVLAILAHSEMRTMPPQEATSAIFHPFSQEALQETVRIASYKKLGSKAFFHSNRIMMN